jgi:acyl dehydratase
MPLNQSLKGRRYQQVEFSITEEAALDFVNAIGEDNPLFVDATAAREAGFPERPIPPTMLTKLQIAASGHVVADQDLGLDYTRVVHGEQEFEWTRHPVVGETLSAVPVVADIYAKGPNEFLVIEAEIRDAEGGLVCVARGTLLSRGTAGAP